MCTKAEYGAANCLYTQISRKQDSGRKRCSRTAYNTLKYKGALPDLQVTAAHDASLPQRRTEIRDRRNGDGKSTPPANRPCKGHAACIEQAGIAGRYRVTDTSRAGFAGILPDRVELSHALLTTIIQNRTIWTDVSVHAKLRSYLLRHQGTQ